MPPYSFGMWGSQSPRSWAALRILITFSMSVLRSSSFAAISASHGLTTSSRNFRTWWRTCCTSSGKLKSIAMTGDSSCGSGGMDDGFAGRRWALVGRREPARMCRGSGGVSVHTHDDFDGAGRQPLALRIMFGELARRAASSRRSALQQPSGRSRRGDPRFPPFQADGGAARGPHTLKRLLAIRPRETGCESVGGMKVRPTLLPGESDLVRHDPPDVDGAASFGKTLAGSAI